MRRPVLIAIALATALVAACAGDGGRRDPAPTALSGGAGTVFDATVAAFAQPTKGLPDDQFLAFSAGNNFFNDNWVIAPSSTNGRDGLGPTFNATSCSACHFKDGRSQPPAPGDDGPGLLVRLSVPGTVEHGIPKPEPTYGLQLNEKAIPGVPAEGRLVVDVRPVVGHFADGTPYRLAAPSYRIEGALGPLATDALLSPRVAPAMIGVGLLEAIPEAAIVARADPDDRDGDGISGRPNRVWDQATGAMAIGRLGWKANQPSVPQQVADAFIGDIGISSTPNPDQNCTTVQTACRAAITGGSPELDDAKLDRVVFYSRTLAVPARRAVGRPDTTRGAATFSRIGCASCHAPTTRTGAAAVPTLSNQEIHPYTDLLLHDLGPGLADGRPDFEASGSEWRTAPLWGIGLVQTVNGHTRFLHDGRAGSVEEAILWHGGEAAGTQARYTALPAADRGALLAFLQSL